MWVFIIVNEKGPVFQQCMEKAACNVRFTVASDPIALNSVT